MGKMFVGSIDLSKIAKEKVITKDKNGNVFASGAKYYNVVVWLNDEPDQYGNIGSIQESISKEDKEAGVKGVYIGNFKGLPPRQEETPLSDVPSNSSSDYDDDLGF